MDTCGLEGRGQDHRLQGHGTRGCHPPAVTLADVIDIPASAASPAAPAMAPHWSHHTLSDAGLSGICLTYDGRRGSGQSP
jgi:hypothetical protein